MGAPRIHGELLKLGIGVGQTTVAKYMARRRRPPSQGWKTFLHNHADAIAAIDTFVVPTISFGILCGLVILQPQRRGRARAERSTAETVLAQRRLDTVTKSRAAAPRNGRPRFTRNITLASRRACRGRADGVRLFARFIPHSA
jgi:hypothetical protein